MVISIPKASNKKKLWNFVQIIQPKNNEKKIIIIWKNLKSKI